MIFWYYCSNDARILRYFCHITIYQKQKCPEFQFQHPALLSLLVRFLENVQKSKNRNMSEKTVQFPIQIFSEVHPAVKV